MPKKNLNTPTATKARVRSRKRLSADSRKKEFIDKAVAFFAEFGFSGGTRELARRLNVSQPLLYRYFPSKEDLVREVYNHVYLNRWRPEWDALLADRSIPLQARLQIFFEKYTDNIFEPNWLRIYLFSGLKEGKINKWYIEIVEKRILKPIVREFRVEHGLLEAKGVADEELELAWMLQSGIFYYGIRKFIYEVPVLESKPRMIANSVRLFLEGMNNLLDAQDQLAQAPTLKPAAKFGQHRHRPVRSER